MEADVLINVALNKPASQSSLAPWSHGSTPEDDARGANNGMITGEMGFHTQCETNPWWQVDLEDDYLVERFEIFNRQHCAEWLLHFSILASRDGQTWLTVFTKSDDSVFGQVRGLPFVVTLPEARVARYIRVRLDGTEFLHFDEFRAFGKALDPEAHARLVQANAERDGIPPGRTGHWAQIDQFEVLFDSVNYDPDIQYALAIGDYESPERKVVKRIIEPHDRIIEAGTAIGLVAMTGASIVGAEAVLTFDANPAIAADARTNFRRNGLDGIQSLVGVLRNERRMMGGEASVDFFVCKKFWMSRLDAASDPDVIRVEKVPVFCLEAEIRNHAANVLICDIEGGEYDLLYEAELASINKILIETHYWAAGKRRIDKLMRLLILEGFSLDLDHSCGHISLLTR